MTRAAAIKPAESASTHWIYLILLTLFLAVPFFVPAPTGANKELFLAGIKLPPLCISQSIFHVDCPACGLTRAFVFLAHGEWREALRLHRLSPLVYAALWWIACYHAACLFCFRWVGAPIIRALQQCLPWVIIVALLLNWVLGFWLDANGS